MAPLARRIAGSRGILEPLQTEGSVAGQIHELSTVLQEYGDPPMALVGHSWGAWLSVLVAAQQPQLVSRLILVGSPPFTEEFASEIRETRLRRLSESERQKYAAIGRELSDSAGDAAESALLARLGELAAKADQFDAVEEDQTDALPPQPAIFESVWPEAATLRSSGELLRCASRIRCPVLAVHGDHDPHPPAGVNEPLAKHIPDFRSCLLQKCGHKPWVERWARDAFLEILETELSEAQQMDAGGLQRADR